jgi:formate hydrogenlyase subunit 4
MISFTLALAATLLHAALIFAAAPLAAGIIIKCRARLTGHPAPPLRQPYLDLAKQLNKTTLIPDHATDLYAAWPYCNFAASAAAALVVPSFCTGMLTAPASDFFTLAGLFALARAAAWAGGLETGIAAGGAAVSRDLLFTICAAAAWAAAILTLVLTTHTATIDAAAAGIRIASGGVWPALALALAAGIIPALAAPGNQADMQLEYSGRYLLLFEYAAMLRQITGLTLIGALLFPFGMGRAAAILTWPAGLLLWGLKILVLCAAFALVRTILPSPRPARAPAVLAGAALLGIIAAILLFTTAQSAP